MDHNAPGSPSQTRSYILRVRLTPWEADLLNEVAQRDGVSMSHFAAVALNRRLRAFERWKGRKGGH